MQSVISKQADETKLIEAIVHLLNGNGTYFTCINQDVLQKVELLTERELQIAILISNGKGNKEIVLELNIKETTVSTFRKRIFEKLGVNNNIELANFFSGSVFCK